MKNFPFKSFDQYKLISRNISFNHFMSIMWNKENSTPIILKKIREKRYN